MWHGGDHEDWVNEVVGFDAGAGFGKRDREFEMLIVDPQHYADGKEDEEEREDERGAEDEGAAAVADVFAGEDALDDELFGAVRGHNHDGAADDAHPDV